MPTQVRKDLIKNSLLVFLGGVFYGFTGSIIKLAYEAGFTSRQVAFSQVLVGWLTFTLLLIVRRIRLGELSPFTPKDVVKLMLAGVVTAGTTFFYTLALSKLPASVAITLLFQFTWIGLVIEVVVTRRKPSQWSVIAALIIFVGTLFASGLFMSQYETLDTMGIVYGLLSAICCAFFLFATGNIALGLPATQRSFFILFGGFLAMLVACPNFFSSGALQAGILKYTLPLGLIASVIPVYLFASAAPWLPNGLVSIMASSELPASVLCAVFILGEYVAPLRYVGVALILLGVVVSQLQNLRFKSA